MPATYYQHQEPSPSPSHSSFRFSIFSRRRDQVQPMDPSHGGEEPELESLQRLVAQQFHHLASCDPEDLLSIAWLRKLLDTFLLCQEQFRIIILNNSAALNQPPMEKHISDFFERSIKALDVCNAIRDGLEQIRQWQKLLEIIACALDDGKIHNKNTQGGLGEAQFRRAKKALVELCLAMIDEKQSSPTVNTHMNRSFGRHHQRDPRPLAHLGHFRSLSWSVSRSWSAARQLQAIGNNLIMPRPSETISTGGLNVAVFTMSYVLLFVLWALVAAIPCQDRGLTAHFGIGRQFAWASPMLALHEKILEESKRRDRRNACGLLREIRDVERCARSFNDLTDFVSFPLSEDKDREVRSGAREMGSLCEGIKEGLDPLECVVREVFRRIVRVRTDGLDSIAQVNR